MMPTNSGRLQYVVANFKSLQGLRMAAIGTFILVVFFPWRKPGDLTLIAILFLPGAAGLIYAFHRIGIWYELKFGHVEAKMPRASVILMILFLGILPWCLHPGSSESFSAYMKGFTFEWWLGWFFFGIGVIQWRRWWYLPFGMISLLLGWLKATGFDVQMTGGLDGLYTILMGVAYIAMGLMDHYYLIQTLPGLGHEHNA